VRTFTPSSWISSVACPIHVIVGSAWLARRTAPSLATRGSVIVRGAKIDARMRATKKRVRVHRGGRPKAGLSLAKPCSR
jgi:hypothetical protein